MISGTASEDMPTTKRTRIAYLKRMLKRLEGEEIRVQQLVSVGELSREGGELTAQQIRKSRAELLSELQKLESGSSAP